jgi:hypothetical protein
MMKSIRTLIFFLCLVLLTLSPVVYAQTDQPTTPVVRPRPTPTQTVTAEDVTLEVFFNTIEQGRVGLLRLSGETIIGATTLFREKESPFFFIEGDAFYGFLVIDMDTPARDTLDYTITVKRADNLPDVALLVPLTVTLGGFVRQEFNLAADRTYLMDAEIERVEYAKLDGLFTVFTEEKLWGADGFQYPINADITSPFGAFRVLNGTFETRHTGWDLRAAVGTPVMAMGGGVVAYAGLMDIRGNCVIINHGYGIFSAYAHFSQVHVTTGQEVVMGQIIGVSGNTGRSNGPHLHWEMAVNDIWIDSVDFMAMWIP